MMREILFRGKRKDNGGWVEGNFYESQISGCYILENKLLATVGGRHSRAIIRDKLIPYEVDPSTVGQYTGLKDKNGKRIFEGDIVQYYERQIGGEDAPIVQPVGFEQGGFGVYRYFLNNWLRDAINGNILLEEIEVIGNIHDNPELMEIK